METSVNVQVGGFPLETTTTTTTSAPAVKAGAGIYFDRGFINPRNIPAMLKVAQMVLDLLGYIFISVTSSYGAFTSWFSFVSMTGLFCTGTLLVLYVMHVIERLQRVPWLMGEFGFCALWTFFYLTASSASAAWGAQDGFNAAAAFFGFAAMIVYAVDAFLKFKGWRRGDMAQGERQVQDAGPEMPSPGAY